ncbi:MAG: C40 family peptidase [Spirochaetia bacterium]
MWFYIKKLICFTILTLALQNIFASNAGYNLIKHAKKYLGTPYLFTGTTRAGMDCSGLVYTAAKESSQLNLPRTSGGIHSIAKKIPTEDLVPGDLVFFKTTKSGRVSHVGIYLGGKEFIHSASDGPHTGVLISSLDEPYWKKAYFSAGTLFDDH